MKEFDIISSSKKGKMKMTDSEKLVALISYIKGVINGHNYFATVNVENFNSFLKTIEVK